VRCVAIRIAHESDRSADQAHSERPEPALERAAFPGRGNISDGSAQHPDVALELKVRCAIALLSFQLAPVAERGVKAERQERAEAIKDGPFATPRAPKRPN
jgi:hypothetical protein